MIVNSIATLVYIMYLFYNKLNNTKDDSTLDKDNDMYLYYKKQQRMRTTVFIIGILFGLIYLIIFESDYPKIINNMLKSNTHIKHMSTTSTSVSDVNDIYVK
jgi:hypothetical protein